MFSGCNRCWAITDVVEKKYGKKLCKTCIDFLDGESAFKKYYCNFCHNSSSVAETRGNNWIEFILYWVYIIPGILYSVWRRTIPPNVCSICHKEGLVVSWFEPVENKQNHTEPNFNKKSERIECSYCAEQYLQKQKFVSTVGEM